jgi:glutamine synthetase
MTEQERVERGVKQLPTDLNQAILYASQSELVRKTLGEHVFNKLLENKRIEWRKFMSHVTDYEWERYLPLL